MFTTRRAESFAWIIVWVFILWFVLLGIVNLLIFTTESSQGYTDDNRMRNLENNAYSIAQKLDFSSLSSWEEFYIHKNTASWSFDIYTGLTNESYKYVNETWEYIADITTYNDTIYVVSWTVYKKMSPSWWENIIYDIQASIY